MRATHSSNNYEVSHLFGFSALLVAIRPLGLSAVEGPSDYARAFARLENHYFQNAGFLECDGWILQQLPRIRAIPTDIVQGRLDMICPPVSAWKLAAGLEKAELRLIPLAGHALSEPAISQALVTVMDGLRGRPDLDDL